MRQYDYVIGFYFITARAYARAVLGVVILSVCLSHACIVTKLNDALQIFLHHTKGQSLRYPDTKSGWWAMSPSLSNMRSKWPTPFEKRRLRPISAHNVSIVGDSEKSSITTNIKLPGAFQRAINGVRMLPLSALKGGSKSVFSLFEYKSTADRLRRCQLGSPVSVLNIW